MTQPYNLHNIKAICSGAIVSGFSDIMLGINTKEINDNTLMTSGQKTSTIANLNANQLVNQAKYYFQIEQIIKSIFDKTTELLNDNVYVTIPGVVTSINFGTPSYVTSTVTGRIQLL